MTPSGMSTFRKILSKVIFFLFFVQSVSGNISENILAIDTMMMVDSIRNTKKLARQYHAIGDYYNTIATFKQVGILSKIIFPENSIEHINNYLNISLASLLHWEYDSALNYLNIAENLYPGVAELELEHLGDLYSSYGSIYKKKGDFAQARIYYNKALHYLKPAKKQPFINYAILLYNRMGILENAEGNFNKAEEYFIKCLQMGERYNMSVQTQITSYLNLALPYAAMKQYDKSIDIQLKAIFLCLTDSLKFAVSLGKLYNNISLDYLALDQFDLAELYLSRSLNIASSNARHTAYLSDIYDSYGKLFEKKGEINLALDSYQKGIINLTNGFNVTNPLINPDLNQIVNKFSALQILKSKTSCLYKSYSSNLDISYLEAAINTAQLTMQLIDDLRNSYLSRESKLQLAEHEDETYKSALDMCYLAYQLTDDSKYSLLAFTIAEKTKSTVLLSSLREMEAKEFGGIPDELLNKERVLSRRIAFYKENIYEENQNSNPDSLKISTWEKYLFQEQREHNELIQLFEKQYPEYFSLKYNTEIVTPEALQKNLKNTTVIEYTLSDSSLYSFLIEKGKFIIKHQKIDSNFYEHVQAYLSLFQEFDFSKQSYTSFTEYCWQSKELYNYLILPIEKEISCDHLLIVPEGILSYLPFETLINQIPTEIPNDYYRNLHYLLYDYAISYSYSSTLYQQVYKGKQAKGKKKLAAFAPEYSNISAFHSSTDQRMVTRQKYRKNLYPIPGVIEEIEEISKIVSADIFSGQEASETAFRKVAGKYELLHLAMHTVVDNKDPMFSKLIFTEIPDSINDGLLNTFEIFGLRLRARMVVLSACSTGEGDYSNGEGVMSLARGFVYAGSPSLVMTMWEVEDKSSISLMKSFYQNLFAGKTKAEALQKSKIEFIQNARPENTHPFFWSSYVVLGNTQAIAWKTSSIILLITLLTVLTTGLVIGGISFYKRLYRQRN
jgi:CHAT domain-containing protein